MDKMGGGESVGRLLDIQPITSVEEGNMEGIQKDGKIIYNEQQITLNNCKKRKTEKLLETLDQNTLNESHECEDNLKRRKREDPESIRDPMTDELDLVCKIWIMELRRMPLDQQLFARKAVCDVIFEARLGQLSKDSVRINSSAVLGNYLTCVHEEQGKTCASPGAWQQPQERSPTSSSQLYPGQPHCYSKATWKGNLSTPQRPPFFLNFSNRFAAPGSLPYPRGPRVGCPIVITTAMKNITTANIVMMTPSLMSTTATSVITTTTPGSSRINTVNIPPYRVDSSTNTSSSYTYPHLNSNTVSSSFNGTTDASTCTTIPSITMSYLDPLVRDHGSTKPTVNASTTPTIYTLCDVHMDTVTADN